MKIDSKIQFPDDFQSGRVGAKKATATPSKSGIPSAGVSSPSGEDTLSLSGTHSEIQRLSAAAKQAPEVRYDRVSELQHELRYGQFNPDTAKIADALITEQTKSVKK